MAEFVHPEWLVEPDWLEAHLHDPDLRIVDCDLVDAYRRAHIPNAVVYSDRLYKDPDDHRYIMGPEQFAAAMSSLGIGDDTQVVGYDTTGTLHAGRLWWCLSYYGHRNVRVLDGGWQRWLQDRRPITMAVPEVAPATFTPRPDESLRATADYVLEALGRPDAVILDVRSDAEWTGANDRGNKRAGHIPGAVHIEWLNNVTAGDVRRLKPPDELRAMFEAAGVTPDKEVVTV
jgi:thiosulfate/3-mercaptopyruvate sulfurtransferase